MYFLSMIERVDLFFSKSTKLEIHNKRSGKGIFEVKRFLLKYSRLSSSGRGFNKLHAIKNIKTEVSIHSPNIENEQFFQKDH